MIEIKEKIEPDLRQLVKSEYKKRFDHLENDSDLLEKLDNKVYNKIRLISASQQSWVRELAHYTKLFFLLIKLDKVNNTLEMENYHKHIVTALSYFIDDDDIIPDHSIPDGFVDDALIINLCLTKLPPKQKNRINELYDMVNR